MEDTAAKLYNSLGSLDDIQQLIKEGEVENQYLECKSPQSPRLDRGLKQEFAEAISAFANTGGGVILWGVSTTTHQHSKMDVLTQIEDMGDVRGFKKQVDLVSATIVEPLVITCESKLLLRRPTDTKGIVVTLVPPTSGDPIRTTTDRKFYLRVGNKDSEMPYETIKRMFAGTSGPDLSALFDGRLVQIQPDGSWKIPIVLQNNSSAAARDVSVSTTIINESACDSVSVEGFVDQSQINPGRKIFMADMDRPIFRGKNLVAGSLLVKMKKQKLPKRKLELGIDIYATNMRAKTFTMVVQLAKNKGFSVKRARVDYLY